MKDYANRNNGILYRSGEQLVSALLDRATQVSYNYYMAMSPVEQKLYISDPEAHQVFKVIQMEQVSRLRY